MKGGGDVSENKNTTALKVVNGAFSALAPLVILIVVYAIAGIFPFGDTLLLGAQNSAWFENLRHYHSAITGGESLFYSFAGGLGGDFYTSFSEGFCNPFWLLTGFYTDETLHGSVSVVMLIQSAAAGLFSYVLFSKLCRDNQLVAVVFASAYSGGSLFALGFLAPELSGAAAFLPLVGAGILTLCENGSFVTLFLSMVLFLAAAPQLWPCLMLFCALFFAWGIFVCGEREQIGTKIALMVVSAGLSFGSLMILLLPGWLTNVELGAAITPVSQIDHTSFRALISGLFPGGFSGAECAPLIYCSSMVVLMLPVYFFNSQLGLAERQISGFSMLFMMICMAAPALGWIWLSGSAPTGIIVGFGFVFCLMACTCAVRSLNMAVKAGVRLIMLSWLIVLVLFLLSVILRWGEISFEVLIFSGASLTLFAAVSLIVISNRKVTPAFCVVLLFCVLSECVLGGVFSVAHTTSQLGLMTTEEYALRREQREWIDSTTTSCENGLASPFFRIRGANSDKYYSIGLNDGSTPRSEALTDALGINGGRGYTPFTDAMLGVRYIVTGGATEYVYPMVGSDGNGAIFMNNASMALGIAAPDAVSELSAFSANPFNAQNELATALAAAPRILFNNAEIQSITGIGATVSETLTGTEVIRYEQSGYIHFSLLAPADGMLYMYIDCDDSSEELAQIGNKVTSVTLGSVSQLGFVTRGRTVDVIVTVTSERLSLDGIYFAVLDSTLCSAALEEYSARQPSQLAVSGNYIRGTITMQEGELLVTSIPYMSGWRAMVDGVETDTTVAAGALLAVKIPAGDHSFELWYEPTYFTVSLVISLLAFALGMIYACAAELLRRRNEEDKYRLSAEEEALANSMSISGSYIDEMIDGTFGLSEQPYIPTYSNDGVDMEYAAAVDYANPQFLPQTGYGDTFFSGVSAEIQDQLYQPQGVVTDEFHVIDPAADPSAYMGQYPPVYPDPAFMPQYSAVYTDEGYMPEYPAEEFMPDEYYPGEIPDPFSGFVMYPQSAEDEGESYDNASDE